MAEISEHFGIAQREVAAACLDMADHVRFWDLKYSIILAQ